MVSVLQGQLLRLYTSSKTNTATKKMTGELHANRDAALYIRECLDG